MDQASGVSARLSIALYENVISNAERRALLTGAERATARPADLYTATSAVTGKVELVYDGEREGIGAVARMLVGKALASAFSLHFPDGYDEDTGDAGAGSPVYEEVLTWFRGGETIELDDTASDADHLARLSRVAGLADLVKRHGEPADDAETASLMELVLEGLLPAFRDDGGSGASVTCSRRWRSSSVELANKYAPRGRRSRSCSVS